MAIKMARFEPLKNISEFCSIEVAYYLGSKLSSNILATPLFESNEKYTFFMNISNNKN